MTEKIKKIIMEDIRPRTRVDGGDVVFNSYENGVVTVTAHGDCASCPCCTPETQRVDCNPCFKRNRHTGASEGL
jgi:Fe-S cluster biogenesis protein NfuA